MKVLIVVDMQKDFIDGSLGSEAARAIVPNVVNKIKNFDGKVYFTRDTHSENYLDTSEGKHLPIRHCIAGTDGWQLSGGVFAAGKGKLQRIIDKPGFGFLNWKLGDVDSIELCGLCTDICVVSNALILRAIYPEARIAVDSACCAGVTEESHAAALVIMKMCHIEVN